MKHIKTFEQYKEKGETEQIKKIILFINKEVHDIDYDNTKKIYTIIIKKNNQIRYIKLENKTLEFFKKITSRKIKSVNKININNDEYIFIKKYLEEKYVKLKETHKKNRLKRYIDNDPLSEITPYINKR